MPEQILDLKVCDPAMGSGAFLVEACRALAGRLVKAWDRWPTTRPTIPPDEEAELHARRLVAQRCLYGVDKNPLATDLAKLSLWLATLARDHEFTFLDHALKSGDSLVGLDVRQIAAMNWDASKPGLPLFRKFVVDRVIGTTKARAEIQSAPDNAQRAALEQQHRDAEKTIEHVRVLGDAVISAFFAEAKPKAREKRRATMDSWITAQAEPRWDELRAAAASLRASEHPVRPFHWETEFPEVFERVDGGFDAMVGNPPFLGGSKIEPSFGRAYAMWLLDTHPGAHGKSDLVAFFFRRAFSLIRPVGTFGFVATNTISQGETRSTALLALLLHQGSIYNAVRRLPWPGDAAVIVSVIHIARGSALPSFLNGRSVPRISAFLTVGDFDDDPNKLAINRRRAFLERAGVGGAVAACRLRPAAASVTDRIVAAELTMVPNPSPTTELGSQAARLPTLARAKVRGGPQQKNEYIRAYVRKSNPEQPISRRWRSGTSMPMWRPAGPETRLPASIAQSLRHRALSQVLPLIVRHIVVNMIHHQAWDRPSASHHVKDDPVGAAITDARKPNIAVIKCGFPRMP
jgi:hypothetical protein